MAYRADEFYVGQRVRIREWDDMEKEFGADQYGIVCMYSFTKYMRTLCGVEATVENIYRRSNGKGGVILTDFDHTEIDPSEFCYSTDMIEPVDSLTAEAVDFSKKDFMKMLGVGGC